MSVRLAFGLLATVVGLLVAASQAAPENASAQSTGEATLKASYQLQGDRLSDLAAAPPLTDIGTGNLFSVETVDGVPREVLTFPQGGGLSLATSGLVDLGDHSVAMLFRLAQISGFRRLIDFSNGTSDNGLYNLNGRAALYGLSASSSAVFGTSYAHLVYTSANAGGGSYDASVYVNGVRVVTGRMSQGFGLGSGALRFFRDNTSGPATGEESAGAVACIQVYDGTLTASEIGQLATQESRCEPSPSDPGATPTPGPGPAPQPAPTPVSDTKPAPGESVRPGEESSADPRRERARVVVRRKPQARRWRGSMLVDIGLTVSCFASELPCRVNGRIDVAPAFEWVPRGSTEFAVAAGARRKVVVQLSRRSARALRRAGQLRIRASATVTTTGGTSATARQTRTIDAPPPLASTGR